MKIFTQLDLLQSGFRLALSSEALKPTDENIADLKVGAFIKIGLTGDEFPAIPCEYCWTQLLNLNHDKNSYQVSIDNDLVLSHIHGLYDGDSLIITKDQILAILY